MESLDLFCFFPTIISGSGRHAVPGIKTELLLPKGCCILGLFASRLTEVWTLEVLCYLWFLETAYSRYISYSVSTIFVGCSLGKLAKGAV